MEHAAVQSPFGEGGEEPSTVFTHGNETDLLSILQALHDKGLGLLLHQQGLGTTSSVGKAMFQMLGVFAEFEQGSFGNEVHFAQFIVERRNGLWTPRGTIYMQPMGMELHAVNCSNIPPLD